MRDDLRAVTTSVSAMQPASLKSADRRCVAGPPGSSPPWSMGTAATTMEKETYCWLCRA